MSYSTLSEMIGLGENIRARRKEKKLTQRELAKIVRISFRTIQNYELNLVNPKIEVLERIAQVFECSLDELVFNTNNQRIKKKEREFDMSNYKNKVEQMLFYEELTDLRRYIDGINDKKERRRVAIQLANLLDEFLKSLQEKQEEI